MRAKAQTVVAEIIDTVDARADGMARGCGIHAQGRADCGLGLRHKSKREWCEDEELAGQFIVSAIFVVWWGARFLRADQLLGVILVQGRTRAPRC